ncbi:hypothetical protein MN0502_28470 [Arthrobacter sp. MN05-02]|nr:hypothetical protein MN0502_28470 [Arthrobacter sp. MN05-02]
MTARTIPLAMPILWAFSCAWFAASDAVPVVAAPMPTPIAVARALRMTVRPIAVSHPKNADPHLMPPNRSFSRGDDVVAPTPRCARAR